MRNYRVKLTTRKRLTSVKLMRAKNKTNLIKAVKRKYPNSKINSIKVIKRKKKVK